MFVHNLNNNIIIPFWSRNIIALIHKPFALKFFFNHIFKNLIIFNILC